ncbi:MAG: SPOR domain-containing protein [Deltaproteobacteria bacterium]|nr:SPOR domain-containing protein [Deltaproteobacteria bacterium]
MAYGLKRKEPLSFVTNSQSIDSVEKKKREISISFGQLCALWGVIAVMMVIVFFFGVHAGLDQGLKRALDEQDTATLRYPLPASKLTQDSSVQVAAASGSRSGLLAQDGFQPANSPVNGPGQEPDKFDFSGVTAPSTVDAPKTSINDASTGSATAGLAGKTAAEILDGPAPTGSQREPALRGDRGAGSVAALEEDLTNRPGSARVGLTTKVETSPKTIEVSTEAVAPIKPEAKKALEKVVTKVETPQKPEKTKPEVAKVEVKEQFRPGLYVQVAAPTSRAEADSVIRKMNRLGIQGRVVEGRVNGVLYHRVVVGPEKSRAAADQLKARIARSGLAGSSPFVKQLPSRE